MIEERINLNHEKAENLKDVQRNVNVTYLAFVTALKAGMPSNYSAQQQKNADHAGQLEPCQLNDSATSYVTLILLLLLFSWV